MDAGYPIINSSEKAGALERDYENATNLLRFLGKEIATVKQTLMTHRTINHWDAEGLLLPRRGHDKEWRRFTISDLFWINTIDSLRKFGFPIEKIKIVKSQLFSKSKKTTRLNEYIKDVLILEHDWYLLVYPNGKVAFEDNSSSLINRIGSDFIRISFYEILEKILGSKDVSEISPTLTKAELSLLLSIRKGQYKEISITLKDGNILRFDATKDVDTESKAFEVIRKLIREGNFQDIVVKQQDGKVVSIVVTTKIKPDMP